MDLDALNDDQRAVLQSFQSVTEIDDVERATDILVSHSWVLEAAVQSFYEEAANDDPPSPPPVGASSSSSSTEPNGVRRRVGKGTVPATGSGNGGGSGSGDGVVSPATGPPPPPPGRRNGAGGQPVARLTLFQKLTYPITLGLHVAWVIFSFTVSLLPFQIFQRPRRRAPSARRRNHSTDPQAAAARFLLDFEHLYGTAHPEFFQGTYSQALDVAKRELRYLLVILQSSEHDDTDEFNRTTLTSGELLTFLLERNCLVWAGDVKESESFQVSNVLLATRYPFAALIAPQGSRMVVVDRLEGPTPPDRLVRSLRSHMTRVDSNLQAIRADRERQDQARSIRSQQDQAYQASLRADQEKERKAREERERKEREREEEERVEREREERIEARRQRKIYLKEHMAEEPPASEKEVAKLSLRLPDGARFVRRFRASDTIQ
ncbi:hypothetical protein HK101_007603, partial [Irineochytrium annulatum]